MADPAGMREGVAVAVPHSQWRTQTPGAAVIGADGAAGTGGATTCVAVNPLLPVAEPLVVLPTEAALPPPNPHTLPLPPRRRGAAPLSGSMRIAPDLEGSSDSSSDADFNLCDAMEDAAENSREADAAAASGNKRRRKSNRDGRKRLAKSELHRLNGSKRVCREDQVRRGLISSGQRAGRPFNEPTRAGKNCSSSKDLESIELQLSGAIRTVSERKTRAKYSNMPLDSVSTYNLSRLASLATALFFDPLGNFLFHAVCMWRLAPLRTYSRF